METIKIENYLNGKKTLSHYTCIRFGKFCSVYYYSNNSNCKLITLEYLSGVFSNDNKEILKNFEAFLNKSGSLMFFIHVTNKDQVNKISKYYKLIYCQQVPVGYSDNFQYHCCFLSRNTNYANYNNYEKRINEYLKENPIKEFTTDRPVVEKNISIEDFILKATNEEVTKIRSYKQQKRKQNLIKLITER